MKIKSAFIGLLCICIIHIAHAQDSAVKAVSAAVAQANNPLAKFTALNLHYYYIGELTELNTNAQQAWLRFATPFSLGKSKWLMRASLPFNSFPVQPDLEHKTGLGDFLIQPQYMIPLKKPGLSFGVGPQITAPTATVKELGAGKWSAGILNMLFNYRSKKFQWGYLVTWQASFAGASDRDDVNAGGLQPFLFYQLGKGSYLRSTAIASFNFDNSTYIVPVGFGFGQVIPKKKAIFNLFVEPQFAVASKGAGWPQWQVFVGLNTQFK